MSNELGIQVKKECFQSNGCATWSLADIYSKMHKERNKLSKTLSYKQNKTGFKIFHLLQTANNAKTQKRLPSKCQVQALLGKQGLKIKLRM